MACRLSGTKPLSKLMNAENISISLLCNGNLVKDQYYPFDLCNAIGRINEKISLVTKKP